MAKDDRRFGPADQAVVVKALLGGATVVAAAKAAGFCVQTLYSHRLLDAVFREAWDAAVEESARPMLVAPRGGRRPGWARARSMSIGGATLPSRRPGRRRSSRAASRRWRTSWPG
jgi:hypothetical protein